MKTEIRKEIEKYFALQSGNGAYSLSSLDQDFPGWVFRNGLEYGVFVYYEGGNISESFSGAKLYNSSVSIDGSGYSKVLMLSCVEPDLRNEFSLICEDFISTDESGSARNTLTENPLQWWEKWRELLGDAASKKLVYDMVGELWAVLKLCQDGENPYWSASKLGSRDIELTDESYEVKSTLKKEVSQIHVSSQFQFESDKPLYLVFTRLEESISGQSIDDLMAKINRYQPKRVAEYNGYLESRGFGLGNHFRKTRYTILERRLYTIDDSFPRITMDMFINGKIPDRISHLEYTVNLDGIPYENWK